MGTVYKTVYRCEYVLDIGREQSFRAYSDIGLDAFVAGFWIDEDYKFNTKKPAKYWVPPHCIKFVVKDRVQDKED